MSVSSEPRKGGLGMLLLFAAGIAFAFFAPIGLLTVPLASMVLVTRFGRSGSVFTVSLLSGISLWWLVQIGDPSDQVVRAAALIGTAAFVTTTMLTNWSLTHRSLAAICLSTGGIVLLLRLLRTSWSELRWWVETDAQFAMTQLLAAQSLLGSEPAGRNAVAGRIEQWIDTFIPLMADFFPATIAVQMFVGFALASALHRRWVTAAKPLVGRFAEFRFSEHLGWIPVVALVIFLVTKVATVKLMAANVLGLAGFLYAVRGAAVAWFGLTLAGGPGFLTTGLMAFSVVFMLPVVLIGAILVGVADTGLDLRRRWATPQKRA